MFKQATKNNRKNSSEPQPLPNTLKHQGQYKLSTPMVTLLSSLLIRPINSSDEFPTIKLHELCEAELERLAELKSLDVDQAETFLDNQLTLSVINIQNEIFLNQKNEDSNDGYLSPVNINLKDEQFQTYQIDPARLMIILKRIENDDLEIRKFVDKEVKGQKEVDFSQCLHFFANQSIKLSQVGKEKIVISRVRLLQTITFFLKEAIKKIDPQKAENQKGLSDGSIIYDVGSSFLNELNEESQENDVNNWSKYSSKKIQDKVQELSNICEQITQLQIFNRTLQFSQLNLNQKNPFIKIIEVLIGLHHRASYLSRSRPELMTQLESVSDELIFINKQIETFLSQFDLQSEQIQSIDFSGQNDKWQSQLSEQFTVLQNHLHRYSEIIISQDILHSQSYKNNQYFMKTILLFSKLMNGEQQFHEEWMKLMEELENSEETTFNENEKQLLFVLDQCLSLQKCKSHRTVRGRENLSNRTNEQLEFQVHKLIEDYERLQKQNEHLTSNLELQYRLKQELLAEVDEREKIITSLSARNLDIEHWLNKKDQKDEEPQEDSIKEEDLTILERQVQKCREHNLHFREQLIASEKERQKLQELLEVEKSQKEKQKETLSKVKVEKERLETEVEELKNKIQSQKHQNIRQSNKLNDMLTDLTGEKVLLEQQLDIKEKNIIRLGERLSMSEKKIVEYNNLLMSRLEDRNESVVPSLEREIKKLKKENQNYQNQLKDLELQIQNMKEDAAVMRFKVKQSQIYKQDEPQDGETVLQLKTKLKGYKTKNQILNESQEKYKIKIQELKDQVKENNNKIKELQDVQKELEVQNQRLIKMAKETERMYRQMQQKIDETRLWAQKEIRNAKQTVSKKDIQLFEKISILNSQHKKIKALEDQLNQNTQVTEKTSYQLVETKIKQYESSIETHKLLTVKFQEQAQSLREKLEEKIENELKLKAQIQRLVKEINGLKGILQKYSRELSEKEEVIQRERQKNDQNLKKIREFEVKEKVRKERIMTPERDYNQESKPNTFKSPISEIQFKQNFELKKHNNLQKKIQSMKKENQITIERLRSRLEETQKINDFLKEKISKREQQFKRKKSEVINQISNSEDLDKLKKEIQKLNQTLGESQLNFLKVERSKNFLQQQLESTKQRLNEQTENFKMLVKEKKLLQEKIQQISSVRCIETSRDESIDKIKELESKIDLLNQNLKQSKEMNKTLKQEKDKEAELMSQEFDNMFNHYQTEMKRVIKETDSKNDEQLQIIQTLRKQVDFLTIKLSTVNAQCYQNLKMNINTLQVITKEQEQIKKMQMVKKESLRLKTKTSGVYHTDSIISLKNLLEYAFRIIIFSNQINPTSKQGVKIKEELKERALFKQGESLFQELEQYTLNKLRCGVVEEYKRNLMQKIEQLSFLKQKMEQFIKEKIKGSLYGDNNFQASGPPTKNWNV